MVIQVGTVWFLTRQLVVSFILGAYAAQDRAWAWFCNRIFLGRCGRDQFSCGYTALTVFLRGILTGHGGGLVSGDFLR